MDDDLQVVRELRPDHDVQDEEVARRFRGRFEADRARNGRSGRIRSWFPRFRARAWVPLTAGALTIGVLIGVAVVRDAAGPEPAGPDSSILQEAAAELETGPDGIAIPGAEEWLYRNAARASDVSDQEGNLEQWLRADAQRAATRELDGELIVSGGAEASPGPTAGLFANLVEAYEFYDSLPDDPQAALDVIYGKVDESGYFQAPGFACDMNCHDPLEEDWNRHGGAFMAIQSMLHVTTPPDVAQAKLLLALAEVPGVEDAGTVTDITGEEVLAVTWKPPFQHRASDDVTFESTTQLLIDPDTSRYIGYQTIETATGTIQDSEVIVSSGFVADTGQTP